MLYQRLRELTDAGLVVRDEGGAYRLTTTGADLGDALAPLSAWAEEWAARPA